MVPSSGMSDIGKARSGRRVCIIVLGMHRSGTSAFARVASLLGCDLPQNVMGPSEGNHHGHWESNTVVTLNDKLLASAGSRWDDWMPLADAWAESAFRGHYLVQASAVLTEQYGASPFFVLKDPRICRIAPLWFEAIDAAGADAVVAMPVRNPIEVAESLAARDGVERGYGLLVWLRNVLEAERASRGKPRCVFAYGDLLRDWSAVAAKITQSTGIVWPRQTLHASAQIDDFLTEDARHQRIDDEQALGQGTPLWVREVYTILKRWTTEGEVVADHTELDRIRGEFDAAAPTFAQLMMQGTGSGKGVGEAERQRVALLEQAERLTDELAQQRARSEAVSLERTSLEAMIKTQEGRIAELDELTERSGAMLREREAHVAIMAEQKAELALALQRLDAVNGELDSAKDMIGRQEEQASLTLSKLRQREEEISQTLGELALEKRSTEMLSAEIERRQAHESVLFDRIGHVERLLQEQNHALIESEKRALNYRWQANEALLTARFSDEALSRRDVELAAAKAEYAQLEHENRELRNRIGGYEREVADLVTIQIGLENRLVSGIAPPTAGENRHGATGDVRLAVENAQDMAIAESQRAEQLIVDLAHVSQLAVAEAGRAQESSSAARWLSELSFQQSRQPFWWHLLPRKEKRQRFLQKLKASGHFDHEAYGTRYPDVIEAGFDPLEHYVRHGIFEGRTW